jgi:uncharacterized membrane-anchored protein YjiN (DUF445 family)
MALSLSSTDWPAESAPHRNLRRNRALATALLGIMVVIFIITGVLRTSDFAVALLRAAAEAGIVGGLADWFAVTALFRHPLGLPIPHTAILPSNRDRIGHAIGRFVEQSFLTSAVLLPKLKSSEPARHLAVWLARPATVEALIGPVMALMPQVWREAAGFGKFLDRALARELRSIDVAPFVGHGLRLVAASGEADVLFERAAEAAISWLRDNRAQLDEIVRQRSRWWIPRPVNRAVASGLLDGLTEFLDKVRRADSDARRRFREGISSLAQKLSQSPEYRAQINAAKDRLLDHPDVRAWMMAIRRELSGLILADMHATDSKIRAALQTAVISVGKALAGDSEAQRRVNDLIERLVIQVIARRSDIGSFIAEVIKQWDARTLSDRFELVIGTDLQYIRMNGTIVGAAVGALIFLAERLFALLPQA